ncbi:hypothetical protein KBY76_13275 [Synechococcus sp. GreenBA-s]|nr:hypothetical protein [Synechococcus sp. GreenBA-s]
MGVRRGYGPGAAAPGRAAQNRCSRWPPLETLLLGGLILVGLALLLPTDLMAPRQARWLLVGLLSLGALGVIGGLVATGLHLAEIAKDGICLTVQTVVRVATLLSVTVPCRIRPEAYLGLRVLLIALALLLFATARVLVREWRGPRD